MRAARDVWVAPALCAVRSDAKSLRPIGLEARYLPLSWSSPRSRTPKRYCQMTKKFRVVTRGTDGEIRVKEYDQPDTLHKLHTQIGVDDCSTDLQLRGMPVFRGLIGPMPDGKSVVRYETPEVFESLTKEWSVAKAPRRTRSRTKKVESNV